MARSVFQELIQSWEDLAKAQETFLKMEDTEEWVFRGVPDGNESLCTTLEKVAQEFDVTDDKIPDLEAKLIHEFMRRYHLFSAAPTPKPADTLEWLTLMRHYGAPCRLLDFTFSFLVGSFFALERKGAGNPTIWAINKTWLTREVERIISYRVNAIIAKQFHIYATYRDGNAFRKVFLETTLPPFVSPVSSYRLNERLTIQQGLFLCLTDVKKSFYTNL